MQPQKVIEQLGYTAREARVYLATLTLGEAHISDIAAKVKLPRTSVQMIAEKLHKRGLMNFYVMRRYKYWVAENPERLLMNFERHHAVVREALPVLTALQKANWNKRATKVARQAPWEPFRILADNSLQAILITNDRAEILYVNMNWERQFGYTLEEVRGQNPRIFKSGKTPESEYRRMQQTLAAEQMFQSDEIIDKRRDGTFFNLLTTIFPVRHNGARYYIQILDDITGQKRVVALHKKFKRI